MRSFLVLFLALAGSLQLWAEKVTIYRDSWGTPHVFAETERGAVFGQGYATAEDRLADVMRNYREAVGRLAEAFGPQFVEQDFRARLALHETMSREHYPELPAAMRGDVEAYVAGMNAYMKEHPEKIPAWAIKIEPWYPVALGRYMIFGWSAGEGVSKLGRRIHYVPPRSSNQWSVSPSRTADGAAMLLIDPHLSYAPMSRFHEVRLHGGGLNLSGACVPGTPFISLGHNQYLGWAATTGGPSTTDVYEEELNPANKLQYKYDGQWKDVRVEATEIPVKTESGTRVEKRQLLYTHHGPVVLVEGSRAFVIKSPYIDQIGIVNATYLMAKARNLDEFKVAMALNQWMQQNIMYADVEGNIFYVRTGRVPIRPDGYDWSRPVPGNTSATEWRGIHPMKDLLQVQNPADGYMQNCNADPMTMMAHPPFQPSDFPAYIFNGAGYNPRAERAREALEANRRLTVQDAMGIVLDTRVDAAERYQAALQAAVEAEQDNATREALRKPVELLLAWDGRAEINSAAATLFDAWLMLARRSGLTAADQAAIRKGETLPAEKQRLLLRALRTAATELQQKYGSIEVEWGRIHRLARGNTSYPVAGGGVGGIMTLRALGYGEPNDKGERVAINGQMMTTLVVFKKSGVESYSVLPFGDSDDPASPHYMDQAEKLASRKVMKPAWFDKKQLMPHVVSTTTLDMP